jgi:diaminopimelate epimerase
MLRFTKMHGTGNDFVCLDGVGEPALARRADLGRLAAAVCDRRQGVGGDGLILMSPPDPPAAGLPAVRMRMFNADGTESAMCGNGLRCVVKYAVDHGLVRPEGGRLLVQTAAGAMEATCGVGEAGVEVVTVDMGRPALELAQVPVDRGRLDGGEGPSYRVIADGTAREAVFVSMGNPHAVFYVDDVEAVDLVRVGPPLERHEAFPQRMNVHFVQVAAPGEVTVRTWERGSGITGACGSGACAVCVAGVLTGRTARRLLAHLPGGDLGLVWDERTDHVLMTGPAVEVFSGEWDG